MKPATRRWLIGYVVFLAALAIVYAVMWLTDTLESYRVIVPLFLLGYAAGRVTKMIER